MRKPIQADSYRGYADLKRAYEEHIDFSIAVEARPGSACAVIAPHGGRIEPRTSEVARAVAGDEFNLYLFEGIRRGDDNYHRLHLTSRLFDEPRCLALIERCELVVTIHGFRGKEEEVLIGGLDESLKQTIARYLEINRIPCRTDDHKYPARDPMNICNRGQLKKGVQLEVSSPLRKSDRWLEVAKAAREAMLAADSGRRAAST